MQSSGSQRVTAKESPGKNQHRIPSFAIFLQPNLRSMENSWCARLVIDYDDQLLDFQADIGHGERFPNGNEHATQSRGYADDGSVDDGQQASCEKSRAQSAGHKTQDTQVSVSRLQKSLHQEFSSEGPPENAHG